MNGKIQVTVDLDLGPDQQGFTTIAFSNGETLKKFNQIDMMLMQNPLFWYGIKKIVEDQSVIIKPANVTPIGPIQ